MRKKVTTFTLSLFIGFFVVFFARILLVTNEYVALDDIELLRRNRDDLQLSVLQLNKKIEDIELKLQEAKQTVDERVDIETLSKEVKQYAGQAGFSSVTGEGVVVIIDDSRIPLNDYINPNDLIVHDTSLRFIVDDLRNAGAEAISINGTRIVFGLSEIICNGPTIRINGEQQAQPYIIRAIGDRYKLEAALTDTETYASILKQFGLTIEVNTKVYMEIGKYTGKDGFSYAKIKE